MNRTLGMASVAALAVITGCSTPNLAWVFEFADRGLADRTVIVEGRVLEGGCDGSVLWSARATRTDAADMSPPELAPGTYGLEGVAIDADCVAFATGCVEITIPSSDESTTITLTAAAEAAECPPEQCMAGVCTGMSDGAVDAAMDAPPVDSTPGDTSADVPDTAVTDTAVMDTAVMDTAVVDSSACMNDDDCTGGTCVDGTCCFGCVVFGACVSGDDDGACGRGGGACTPCACPTDRCNAGTCEVGHPIDSLATSSGATCVTSGGQLYCWGENPDGELALGTFGGMPLTPQTSMTSLAFDRLEDGQHTFFALIGGELYGWGDNTDGTLGVGDTTDRSTPVRVGTETTWAIAESGVGGDTSCGIRSDDSLYCWGQNDFGQLGQGTTSAMITTPAVVAGSWIDVTVGHYHACGIETDGSLWCWGRNDLGQLGVGDAGMGRDRHIPTRVGTATDWTHVGAADFHTCGIRGAGDLYCWGTNDDGELGLGHRMTTIFSPARVGTASDWIAVEGGDDHTCGLRAGGSLWCWGINSSGQSGQPGSSDVLTPAQVGTATGWTQLNVGFDHNCVVSPDDALYCWGRNETGAVGVGDMVARNSPVPVCW